MEIDEFIDALEAEGARFAVTLDPRGFDRPVPTCPGWNQRDLTTHVGGVHRWATTIVSQRLQSGAGVSIEGSIGVVPDDEALTAWFVDGHTALVMALRSASPEDDFWRFMRNAPSSLTFWARRQAHETSMHRVDSEGAADLASVPFDPGFAADGIDELLFGFLARKRAAIEPERTLRIIAVDVEREWFVALGTDGVVSCTGTDADVAGPAHGTVSGPADSLHRLLWNRLDPTDVSISLEGDPSALDTWTTSIAIT
jgi:uncharacterized protein (TIGR03083 family)